MARKAVVVVPAPEVAVLSAVDIAKAMLVEARAALAQAKLEAKVAKPAKVKVTPEWRTGWDVPHAELVNGFLAAGIKPSEAKSMANKAVAQLIRDAGKKVTA